MPPAKDTRGSLVPTDALLRSRLEGEADEIIQRWARGISKHSGKADILTRSKEADRRSHEVYVASLGADYGPVSATGAPDRAILCGIYHRTYNKLQWWMNSRTPARPDFPIPRGRQFKSFRWDHDPGMRWDDGLVHPVKVRWTSPGPEKSTQKR